MFLRDDSATDFIEFTPERVRERYHSAVNFVDEISRLIEKEISQP